MQLHVGFRESPAPTTHSAAQAIALTCLKYALSPYEFTVGTKLMHRFKTFESAGSAVAAALMGAWRKSPPKLELPAQDLAAITPVLLRSGAGALGWWRCRHSHVQMQTDAVQQLRDAYLHYAIHAAEHERQVSEVFEVLRSRGVEPILLKGWAIGRLYPEAGLRPTGDIDLCVSPAQRATAQAVLDSQENQRYWIDLEHDEITRFGNQSFEELYSRSDLVRLNATEVRVLSAEDHLRILCLHLLKHGAWRPLWLCDVAAALESRPSRFDWERFLGRDTRRAQWIFCTAALAQQLLGAQLDDSPLQGRSRLPRWLLSSVLKQWSAPCPPHLPLFVGNIGKYLREPAEIVTDIRRRWPNPIQATIDANGRFDDTPRLPFQLGNCAVRTAKVCRQLQQLLHR